MSKYDIDVACQELPDAVRMGLQEGFASFGNVKSKLIEGDLLGEGGFAFHISDLVGIDDVLAILGQVAIKNDPVGAAVALFKTWMKLREIRVALTGEEVRVLRSIKRGSTSVHGIAEDLKLDQSDAGRIVDSLKQKSTVNRIPLVTESDRGFSTSF